MNGKQQLVAFIGVALIAANLITGQTDAGSSKLRAVLFNPNADAPTQKAARKELTALVGELLLLLVLVVVAGSGSGVANIAVVFTVGLAVVWAMTRWGGLGVVGANRTAWGQPVPGQLGFRSE